jgi:uncharacterized protein YjdB/plastocyanin
VTIVWSSDDTTVAVVDQTGLVTAVGNGTTVIKASAGGQLGFTTIRVAQVMTSVAVTAQTGSSSSFASIGQTFQLTAVGKDALESAVAGQIFTWTSDASGVVSVDSNGLATAVANGSATVTATSGALSGSLSMNVTQLVTQVAVTASGTTTLATLGATVQLSATAKDAGGTDVAGATFAWTSDNTAIATVNSSGLVTAVAGGTTNVHATSGGQSGSIAINVTALVASVVISPSSAIVPLLGTLQMSAQPKDGLGNNVNGQMISWQSADTSLASINSSGLVTTHDPGAFKGASTTITANAGGVDGTRSLFVAVHPTFAFSTTGGSGLAVTVNQGQYVIFKNTDGAPHSIVWDTPGAPGSVGTFNGSTDSSAVHATQAAGSYSFHCGIHGTSMKGTLTIQ